MGRKWVLIGVMAAFAAGAFAIAAEKGDAEAAPKKADKVLELIEQGRQAYLKEDHQAALTALSKAFEELQDRDRNRSKRCSHSPRRAGPGRRSAGSPTWSRNGGSCI